MCVGGGRCGCDCVGVWGCDCLDESGSVWVVLLYVYGLKWRFSCILVSYTCIRGNNYSVDTGEEGKERKDKLPSGHRTRHPETGSPVH